MGGSQKHFGVYKIKSSKEDGFDPKNLKKWIISGGGTFTNLTIEMFKNSFSLEKTNKMRLEKEKEFDSPEETEEEDDFLREVDDLELDN